jgi:hypothetical protein
MRLPVSLAGLFAATLLLAGCAQPIDGRAVVPPSHASRPLSGDDLDNILLTPPQLSDVVGVKLQLQADVGRPVAGDPAEGPCAALDTVGMQPFIGDTFSAFHLLLLSDGTSTRHDHVVTQAAAIYPDTASATKAFTTVTRRCRPATAKTSRPKPRGGSRSTTSRPTPIGGTRNRQIYRCSGCATARPGSG